MYQLTKYEQETIVNYNAGDENATVYTRDKTVMRKLDTLVTEHPDIYRCIGETDIDKTYGECDEGTRAGQGTCCRRKA